MAQDFSPTSSRRSALRSGFRLCLKPSFDGGARSSGAERQVCGRRRGGGVCARLSRLMIAASGAGTRRPFAKISPSPGGCILFGGTAFASISSASVCAGWAAPLTRGAACLQVCLVETSPPRFGSWRGSLARHSGSPWPRTIHPNEPIPIGGGSRLQGRTVAQGGCPPETKVSTTHLIW
jgi:hypothetical protein